MITVKKIEGDYVLLSNGVRVRLPVAEDYRTAEKIIRKQEALFNELCRLPNTDQGHGRAASIKRIVAKLENQKHPCLREWNRHLFPKEQKILTGTIH